MYSSWVQQVQQCTYNNVCLHQNCHHNHHFHRTLESYSSNEMSLHIATGLVDMSQALEVVGKKAKLAIFKQQGGKKQKIQRQVRGVWYTQPSLDMHTISKIFRNILN